jgi:phosphoribosylformylglycinamidine synthase
MAVALLTPFISGKDSLNNEFSYVDTAGEKQSIAIPPTLLISAMGQVDNVDHCVTMDLKAAGNLLYQVGITRCELGGSHYALVADLGGGRVPRVDLVTAKATFAAVYQAICEGLVRACHDLSEGGLVVAAAEMAFAGGLGASIDLTNVPRETDAEHPVVLLFGESNSRFLCEVPAERAAAFEAIFARLPTDHRPAVACIGEVNATDRLEIHRGGTEMLIDAELETLKTAWQEPLAW